MTTVQQAPGLWRTDLQAHDLSVPGRTMIQNRVELGPEAPSIRHKHPGEEIIYVLEGTLEYSIDGRKPKTYSAGEALQQFLLPHGPYAARHTLSTGLIAEEGGDAQQDLSEIDSIVK